jgi:Predicted phosphohydrolases
MRFILILLLSHLILLVYLGWHCRWAFSSVFPAWLNAWYVYWPLCTLLVLAFPLTHFYINRELVNNALPAAVLLATALLFAFLVIAFTTTLFADVVALIVRLLPVPESVTRFFHNRPLVGSVVLVLILAQVAYGYYQAHTPRETHFSISVNKENNNHPQRLRVVHLTDAHIISYTSRRLYQELVPRINALEPDIIVYTGDIVDRSIKPFIDKNIPAILAELRPRFGSYAVLGNHEYYGESPTLAAETYRQAGLHVMRDEVLYLEGAGITLIGRDDRTRGSARMEFVQDNDPLIRTPRASLETLMQEADPATPIFVLDHQPFALDEVARAGADIMFSGHTHNGQFFPFNLIVAAIYENPWGLLKKGDFHSIVSCGLGTWGPPVRTMSYSEFVVVDIEFISNEPITSGILPP